MRHHSSIYERAGVFIIALVCIVAGIIAYFSYRSRPHRTGSAAPEASVSCVESPRHGHRAGMYQHGCRGQAMPHDFNARSEDAQGCTPTHMSRFNPNTDDFNSLVNAGLTPSQARGIIHYREKAGNFCSADALSRLYVFTPAEFRRVKPYIDIPDADRGSAQMRRNYPQKSSKLADGEKADINSRDTSALMRVPGVGPTIAKRIISYGEKLGGYCSANQAAEVYGLDASATKWFCVSGKVKRIDVNSANYDELAAHPYISGKQARQIINMRQQHGRLRSMASLVTCGIFSANDSARLSPYLKF